MPKKYSLTTECEVIDIQYSSNNGKYELSASRDLLDPDDGSSNYVGFIN